MKCALAYPKIPDGHNCPLKKCLAFEKYDGTNFHWKWKGGWQEFGTRRTKFAFDNVGEELFQRAHPGLETAPEIFWQDGLDVELDKYLYNKYYKDIDFENREVIIFSEFFGPNSFAGTHKEEDIKQHIIFDVMVDGKFLSPEEFLRDYQQFNIAKVVYSGKYTGQFVEDVRKGKYTSGEGVVCKGLVDGRVYMTKIKTNSYLERLKYEFPKEWQNYWE
jgi:hypothetical protein